MALKKEKLGVGKPSIDLEGAWVDDSMGDGYNFLWGIPTNHESKVLNGTLVHTSYVVAVRGNVVETKRSVYNILSWDKDKIHPQAELF